MCVNSLIFYIVILLSLIVSILHIYFGLKEKNVVNKTWGVIGLISTIITFILTLLYLKAKGGTLNQFSLILKGIVHKEIVPCILLVGFLLMAINGAYIFSKNVLEWTKSISRNV